MSSPRHTRGLAVPGTIPSFCATCSEDSHHLRPSLARTWGGKTVTRWLCFDCFEGGDLATLETFEVLEPDETGLHPGASWRKHGAHA